MSNLSPENSRYLFHSPTEKKLSKQEQQEILSTKIGPIIKEGINNGVIKQNDILLPNPDKPRDWIYTTKPATYEIVDSTDNKTEQPIVFMLVKYGKTIKDDNDEIVLEQPTMRIFVSANNFVFVKNDDIDHPQYIPGFLRQPKTQILQLFEN